MNLIQKLTEEAKAAPARRVAMPECEAVKTLQAARRVAEMRVQLQTAMPGDENGGEDEGDKPHLKLV